LIWSPRLARHVWQILADWKGNSCPTPSVIIKAKTHEFVAHFFHPCPLDKIEYAQKQNKRTGRTWIDAKLSCTMLDPLFSEPKRFRLRRIRVRINYFQK
jgi:hypothetical protein